MRERAAEATPGAMSRWLCCQTEFIFTIDSGGLCEVCHEGACSKCGCDEDGGWLDG